MWYTRAAASVKLELNATHLDKVGLFHDLTEFAVYNAHR